MCAQYEWHLSLTNFLVEFGGGTEVCLFFSLSSMKQVCLLTIGVSSLLPLNLPLFFHEPCRFHVITCNLDSLKNSPTCFKILLYQSIYFCSCLSPTAASKHVTLQQSRHSPLPLWCVWNLLVNIWSCDCGLDKPQQNLSSWWDILP